MSKLYFTEDGDLAAYLSYQGIKLSAITTEPGAKRIIFGFEPNSELTKHIEAFQDESTTVKPKAYAIHLRKIRTIISSTKRQLTGGDR